MRIGVKSVLFFYQSFCARAVFTRVDQCSPLCFADEESVSFLQLRKIRSGLEAQMQELQSSMPDDVSLSSEEGPQGDARDAHLYGGSFRTREQQDELAMANCSTSKWIFIWSTGRAGSTTVLTMLNHLPGVYLSGENKGLADSLGHLSHNTLGLRHRADNAWLNTPDPEMVKELARMWICALRSDAPDDSAEYRGFKELAHRSVTQIRAIRHLFPDAYHILNFRNNLTAQMHSAFHAHQHTSEEQLISELEDMRDAVNGANVFELPLEEFSAEKFNSMVDWLGMDTSCTFRSVVHQNDNGGYSVKDDSDPVVCS